MTDYFGTITPLQDPFSKSNIEGVSITMYRNTFTKAPVFYARISFKNGSTTGEHLINNCANLADAFEKAQAFVNSLS